MRFTADTSAGGVREQLFTLGEIPGVLWTPDGATGPRPLILLGHGGGQHKQAPGIVAHARRFVTECGFAAAAVDAPSHGARPKNEEYQRIAAANQAQVAAGADRSALIAAFQARIAQQTVAEWRATLATLQEVSYVGAAPAGYWGISMGCGLGVPFVAAEPRIRAAVLGLGGASANAADAAKITVPVEFLLQWDDERIPREQGLALFDAFASTEKTLHANPGLHGDVPRFEADAAVRFFARHFGVHR